VTSVTELAGACGAEWVGGAGLSAGGAGGVILVFACAGGGPRSLILLPVIISEEPDIRMVENLYAEAGDAAHETPTQTETRADFPLGIEGFTYGDLHRPEGLRALAEAFYAEVAREDASLGARLREYVSSRGESLKGTLAESDLLIASAARLSRFVARLFVIERERERLAFEVRAQDPVFQFKHFVQRRATKSK
jgi:hypothetical protein